MRGILMYIQYMCTYRKNVWICWSLCYMTTISLADMIVFSGAGLDIFEGVDWGTYSKKGSPFWKIIKMLRLKVRALVLGNIKLYIINSYFVYPVSYCQINNFQYASSLQPWTDYETMGPWTQSCYLIVARHPDCKRLQRDTCVLQNNYKEL